MKCPCLPPAARALLAFIATVLLALLAALALLLPDMTAQSVDSMLHLPTGLDEILSLRFD